MKLSAALIYIERNALRERIQEYSFHMTVCRCKRVFRHFVKRCPLLHPALTPRVGILYLWYTKKSFPVTGSRPVRMCAVLFKEGHCYWQLPPPTHQLEMYRNKKKKRMKKCPEQSLLHQQSYDRIQDFARFNTQAKSTILLVLTLFLKQKLSPVWTLNLVTFYISTR